jgi:hypothetical protein
MVVPGLLIEYFVSGVLAAIATYPLWLDLIQIKPEAPHYAIFAVGLYVVGMAVDFAGWALTGPFKKKLRKGVRMKFDLGSDGQPGATYAREAKFAIYVPALAQEVARRSSRDRIARGAIVSSILATIFTLPLMIGIACILLSILMWIGFERVSHGFEISAERILEDKINREAE